AKTELKVLVVPTEMTKLWTANNKNLVDCVELIDIELPEQLNNQRFFHSFSEAYRENKLVLPSLPDVAIKLKEAIDNEGIGAKEAVDIIQVDTAMVAKLIQVANSSLYAPVTPITNCQEAVTRLGLTSARNLVTGIAFKQLFLCKDKKLMGAMQSLWRRSLYVSSLSFVLAEETGFINPDDALLAGLISDIGVIPLLHFAEQYPDEYPDVQELEFAMPYLRAPVGTLMLHTLGFPEGLVSIPRYAEDWHYDSGNDITLIDIVVLAKLHSYFGSKKASGLPYINTIPAYSKLKDGKLNPDFSLHILYRANQRIKDVMRILA
ncbi:MAG: HDOD domain-containing protein, partial [Methylococcaceae bacterium]|nr:HDOD domain-containing protein [Methylococcaceae bacterium]